VKRDTKAQARAINAILWRDWDPIGAGAPGDEYESYVWPVYKLLIEGKPRQDIAAYLRWAADEDMVAPVAEERLNEVVDKLISLGLAMTEGKRQ
jgi:hypothetical protein